MRSTGLILQVKLLLFFFSSSNKVPKLKLAPLWPRCVRYPRVAPPVSQSLTMTRREKKGITAAQNVSGISTGVQTSAAAGGGVSIGSGAPLHRLL